MEIRGKRYSDAQLEKINSKAAKFACPFLCKTTVIHNTIHDARVPSSGITAFRDNDVIDPEFLNCIGTGCMAFDPETCCCSRCK